MMNHLLDLSATCMPLLALAIYFPVIKRIKREDYLIPLYLILTVLILSLARYTAGQGISNGYFFHFYSLVEVCIFLILIYQLTPKDGWIIKIVLPAYALYWFINVFFWEDYREFNSNSAGVASVLIVMASLYYFLVLTHSDAILSFQRTPPFWIITGFLFHALINVFLIIAAKYQGLLSLEDEQLTIDFRNIVNMIKFTLVSIGVLCFYRQRLPAG